MKIAGTFCGALIGLIVPGTLVLAEGAGIGSDANRRDRERVQQQDRQRQDQIDRQNRDFTRQNRGMDYQKTDAYRNQSREQQQRIDDRMQVQKDLKDRHQKNQLTPSERKALGLDR